MGDVREDTMATARNIVNQVLDESGADVETRQRINDPCDEFVARLIQNRVDFVLQSILDGLKTDRETAWQRYMETTADDGLEGLRQGKFESLDIACKRITQKIGEKSVRDGRVRD